jgi:DNA replication protein DnaC
MAAKTDVNAMLTERLRELHLPAFRECFSEEADRARKNSLSYERYLLELVDREADARRQNRTERLLRASKLPPGKTFETFDMARMPARVASRVKVLADGEFLDRAENILAFGNPGSGKSHLLSAIGHELVYRGKRVFYTPCSLLVQDLLIAKRELRLAKALKKLSRFDALVIDDIGYVQHDRDEMEVLFTLLADRYERKSVMLTSNLPFSKWETIFKDPMTTAAAIDRLVHHSVILELNIKSYRLEHSKSAGKTADQQEQEK